MLVSHVWMTLFISFRDVTWSVFGGGLFSAPRRSRHIKQRRRFPVSLSSDYHRVSWASDIVSTPLQQLFRYHAISQWTAMSGGRGGWAVIRDRLFTAVCSVMCTVDNNYHLILASHHQFWTKVYFIKHDFHSKWRSGFVRMMFAQYCLSGSDLSVSNKDLLSSSAACWKAHLLLKG